MGSFWRRDRFEFEPHKVREAIARDRASGGDGILPVMSRAAIGVAGFLLAAAVIVSSLTVNGAYRVLQLLYAPWKWVATGQIEHGKLEAQRVQAIRDHVEARGEAVDWVTSDDALPYGAGAAGVLVGTAVALQYRRKSEVARQVRALPGKVVNGWQKRLSDPAEQRSTLQELKDAVRAGHPHATQIAIAVAGNGVPAQEVTEVFNDLSDVSEWFGVAVLAVEAKAKNVNEVRLFRSLDALSSSLDSAEEVDRTFAAVGVAAAQSLYDTAVANGRVRKSIMWPGIADAARAVGKSAQKFAALSPIPEPASPFIRDADVNLNTPTTLVL